MLKLTCWARGSNLPTLQLKRARAHQTDEPKRSRGRLRFGLHAVGDTGNDLDGVPEAHRFRSNREQLERVEGPVPGSQGQNLALTVLCVP